MGTVDNTPTTVVPGQTLQLKASATLPDGSTRDVTNNALWQSSNPVAATVSSSGLVKAVVEGAVDVTATYQNVIGRAHVEIRAGCEASTLSPETRTFDAFASPGSVVSISTSLSDCRWTVVSDAPWLSFENGQQSFDPGRSGDGSVGYYLSANNFPTSRTGHVAVIFSDGSPRLLHTVIQQHPVSCSYVVTPDNAFLSAGGGSGSFDVSTTPPDCQWTAVSGYSAMLEGVEVVSGGTGTGAGKVSYTVGRNVSGRDLVAVIQVSGLSKANPPAWFTVHISAQ